MQDPWLQGKTKQFWCLSHTTIEHNVNVFDVWAPQRLADKILEEHYDFVFNKGFAKSTKTGNFYFKFSVL